MSNYIAPDGQEITEEMIDVWIDEYESDDWSHMRFGDVVYGPPPLSRQAPAMLPLDEEKQAILKKRLD